MTTPFRTATAADARHLGELLGEAFADDPVARWTFGDPRAIKAGYVSFAQNAYVPLGASQISDGAGGAMWLPPGTRAGTSVATSLTIAAAMLRYASVANIRRGLLVDAAMQARHPKEPHFYLFLVGVVPSARGRGLASAILRQTLSAADESGTPAYLENSNPANTRLYESLGFRARQAFVPAPGCPPLVPMWRDAR